MRSTIFAALALTILAAFIFMVQGAVYLPESSARTIREYPLESGTVAVVPDAETGVAAVYFGADGGHALRVMEPSTIRGYRRERVPADESEIVASAGVLEAAGAYTLTNAPSGQIYISAEDEILALEYDVGYTFATPEDAISTVNRPVVTNSISGRTATIHLLRGCASSIIISNPAPVRVAFGDTRYTNDLTRVTYQFRDDMGVWKLDQLRPWVRDLYNGNRGADWSRFPATNTVRVNSRRMLFDTNARYTAAIEETNLVFAAGGRPAVEFSFRGINMAKEGSLRFTSFEVGETSPGVTNVTAAIDYDIDGFDPSRLTLKGAADLAGPYTAVTGAVYDAATKTFTAPHTIRGAYFFRLSYDDSGVANTSQITVSAPTVFDDAVIIRGSGASVDTLYRITVEDGVISATPYTP